MLTVEDESWLLVPAPAWLLDTLAGFGAEAEDREPSLEDEPETDAGIEDGWEDDRDDEYDFRRAPRRLSGRSVRVAKAYEERMGVVAIRELTADDGAEPGARRAI